MHKIFKTVFWASLFALGGTTQSFAAGSIQFYGDGGLYSATTSPSGPVNTEIFILNDGTMGFNTVQNIAGTPEGRQVTESIMGANTGGWWGIANVDPVAGPLSPNYVVTEDYSEYAGGMLRFQVKSATPLDIRMEYVNALGNIVQTPRITIASTGGLWKEQVLPLSTFGASLSRIRLPFIVIAGVPTTFYIDDVRWTKPVARLQLFPGTPTVSNGRKRLMTVEGVSAAGERILIHSTFTVSAPGVGSMSLSNPTYVSASTLTSSGSNGTVLATMYDGFTSPTFVDRFITGRATVTVTATPPNEKLGLFSETIPGVVLVGDGARSGLEDSKLLVFSRVNGLIGLANQTVDAPEGQLMLGTTVQHTQDIDFSGWTIVWGIDANTTNDAVTRDLSQYYEGSLRFWVKVPAVLYGKLSVGIRSGNIEAGKEVSKVLISSYTTFDNTWRPVAIPLSHLMGGRPFADPSRMKNLVTFAVVGQTSGLQTFYIDNIRWDTTIPGPLTSVEVLPLNVNMPPNSFREFTAIGHSAGGDVDITPTWTVSGGVGTIVRTSGNKIILKAANGVFSGRVRATVSGIFSEANVNVAPITYTQSFNIYSDMGSGGFVGVSTGPATPTITALTLSEVNNAADRGPEGLTYRRATYTLDDSAAGAKDSYALWFTEDVLNGRYMHFYANGYLHFWVRTAYDLEIAIRSANLVPGTERSKFTLSELGIPRDNTWQEVVIALPDFKAREPNLNFDDIKNFFTITALSRLNGEVTNKTFDVDDVKWLTASSDLISAAKVLQGLRNKQRPSGMVRSFENKPSAFTYDQALAAMAFTYYKDTASAKKIFDAMKSIYPLTNPPSAFYDEYDVDTKTVRNANKLVGPNAWMVLALLHYKNVTGSTDYDSMTSKLGIWIYNLRQPDGSVTFGQPANASEKNIRSTEHNMDAYAALHAFATSRNLPTYHTAADNIFNWLNTKMWNPAQRRFYVGTGTNGTTPNTDRALDVYSWAPLALSSFTATVYQAETDFGTRSVNGTTGASIDGFDFAGCFGNPVDKDAVWLEGTAQMAMAYYAAEDSVKALKYLNELNKSVIPLGSNGQGLTYATRAGTYYGPCGPNNAMDATNPAVSSMVWYLFAVQNFNPFKVYPFNDVIPYAIATATKAANITWTNPLPGSGWKIANEYVKIEMQGITVDPWGLQIYTDNTNINQQPRYIDPTPLVTTNNDSDPSGLLLEDIGYTQPTPDPANPSAQPTPVPFILATTNLKLPFAWTVKDTTATVGVSLQPADPNLGAETGPSNRYQWLYIKDFKTPDIDRNGDGDLQGFPEDTTKYDKTEPFVRIRQSARLNNVSPEGFYIANGAIHGAQGPEDFFNNLAPDYVYFEADYTEAIAQSHYTTNVYFEFFTE